MVSVDQVQFNGGMARRFLSGVPFRVLKYLLCTAAAKEIADQYAALAVDENIERQCIPTLDLQKINFSSASRTGVAFIKPKRFDRVPELLVGLKKHLGQHVLCVFTGIQFGGFLL